MCFVHFDLEVCFASQLRALFSTSQLPKVVRTWCFAHFDLETRFAPQRRAIFHLSTASAALASLLFDPPEPQIIGKTQCFAIFLPFRAPGSLF